MAVRGARGRCREIRFAVGCAGDIRRRMVEPLRIGRQCNGGRRDNDCDVTVSAPLILTSKTTSTMCWDLIIQRYPRDDARTQARRRSAPVRAMRVLAVLLVVSVGFGEAGCYFGRSPAGISASRSFLRTGVNAARASLEWTANLIRVTVRGFAKGWNGEFSGFAA